VRETYRCEYVRCGKRNCRSCPHGPYWYAYWKVDKRTRKRYIGKDNPYADVAGQQTREEARQHPWERIFNRATATVALACEIIGLVGDENEAESRKKYRAEMMKRHPDMGGDAKDAAYLNAAWSLYRVHRGWR
jgi:hypothetical protein